jgi:hypothetical protein
MQNETTYFSVGINGKWSNDSVPLSFFTNKGASVSDSRIEAEYQAGIKTLWIEGRNMGKLFPTQKGQIAYLQSKGLLAA